MTNKIDVRLPDALHAELHEIAKLAGLSVETAVKLAVATEIRRWQNTKAIRAEHKVAMDALRQIASQKRRTSEQRLAAACVTFLGEIDNAA